MEEKVKLLAEALDAIQGREDLLLPLEDGDDPEDRFFDMNRSGRGGVNSPELSKAETLADDVLISESGGYNYRAIQLLRTYGYRVLTLEADSFGPLVSGIRKGCGPLMSFG